MSNKSHLFILLFVIIILLPYGCKDSLTENTYYVTGVDSLSNPNTMPKVIFTNPANGAIGPFGNTDPTIYSSTPQITIQFNKLINIKSIYANSITLNSDSNFYYLRLSDGYTNLFSNILVYNVEPKYLAAKSYNLKIDTTLKDIHGKSLNTPYEVTFIPEPKFRLSYLYPSLTTIEPLSQSQFTLSFNSKLDSSIFKYISVTPEIKGRWHLDINYYSSDSLSVYYDLSDTLAYNSLYTISVSPNAKDHNGLSNR